MRRLDFSIRPAKDRQSVAIGCAVVAVLAIWLVGSATGWLGAVVLALSAVALLRPRCSTRGDAFVMRGALHTRRLAKSDIKRFVVRDGMLRRQYVEVVTRGGEHLRVPGTDRPVPRHLIEDPSARTPADAVCDRLHLWHMVSTA